MYNPKFDYQPIPRVTIDGKRFYATPDGNKLPSVTTILDRTKSGSIFLVKIRVANIPHVEHLLVRQNADQVGHVSIQSAAQQNRRHV